MTFVSIISILALWNLAVMAIYGIDKLKAKRGSRRIPEKILIAISMLMGGVGAISGMVIFHHKVSKSKFRILVPVSLLVTLVVLVWVVCYITAHN